MPQRQDRFYSNSGRLSGPAELRSYNMPSLDKVGKKYYVCVCLWVWVNVCLCMIKLWWSRGLGIEQKADTVTMSKSSEGQNLFPEFPDFLCLYFLLSFKKKKFYALCEGVWPAFISVHHMHAWCPWRPEQAVRFPWTRVTDGWMLLWVLGIEPRSCRRAAGHLSSPSLLYHITGMSYKWKG